MGQSLGPPSSGWPQPQNWSTSNSWFTTQPWAPYQISFGWNVNPSPSNSSDQYQPGPWFLNNGNGGSAGIPSATGAIVYSANMIDNLESTHGSGCNVTFCDSHTIFLRSDINSTVYEQLCNPNDISIPANAPSSDYIYAYPPLDESNYNQ